MRNYINTLLAATVGALAFELPVRWIEKVILLNQGTIAKENEVIPPISGRRTIHNIL